MAAIKNCLNKDRQVSLLWHLYINNIDKIAYNNLNFEHIFMKCFLFPQRWSYTLFSNRHNKTSAVSNCA